MNNEVLKAINSIHYSKQWIKQRYELDSLTNFIYNCHTYNEVISYADNIRERFFHQLTKQETFSVTVYNYAIHRWLNFISHDNVLDLLEKYGAVKGAKKDREKDFTLKGIPYDLKLSRYPLQLNGKFDLSKRSERDNMIKWLYLNQSQSSRKHMKNKLFVMFPAQNYEINKFDIETIEKKIIAYIRYYSNQPFHQINIIDNGISYNLYADLIYVTK